MACFGVLNDKMIFMKLEIGNPGVWGKKATTFSILEFSSGQVGARGKKKDTFEMHFSF